MNLSLKRMVLAGARAAGVILVGIALAAAGTQGLASSPQVVSPGPARAVGVPKAIAPMPGHGLPLAAAAQAAAARPAAAQTAPKAEEVFKNIQVLKGLPVDDFMGTMGIMAAALGFCCRDCHPGAGSDVVNWEMDTPNKRIARRMVTMVAEINKTNFGGRQVVTCWTCHRSRDRPVVTPGLDDVYGLGISVGPDDILTQAQGVPMPDQILDKFVTAIGGAQRWAGITSLVATGTVVGFENAGGLGQVQVYAKAPNQRATFIQFADPNRGDSIRVVDGRTGWIGTPLTAVRQYELSGGELDGAHLDAQLTFPGLIKSYLTNWRVAAPDGINDKQVQVVQGNGPRGLVGTFYFDQQTGLLVRMVRYVPTPIGRVPTWVDYSDYRDVGTTGIKVPYKWMFSWLDGQDSFQLTDVQANTAIDPAKFGRPVVTKQ